MFDNIKCGIENLITWFPVIWKDRQWDHTYLLRIMEKKLQLMEDFFLSEYAMSADAEKAAKRILVAKTLIKRLRKDEYDIAGHDKMNEKWGELEFRNGTIEVENIKTEEDEEEYRKELRKVYEEAEESRKQDLDLFCQYFKKYLRTWWD